MTQRDVVVLGASAGGVEALRDLVSELPADLPAAVLVVLHVPSIGSSALPQILTRAGKLPASHVGDDEPLQPGRIYVAPPDRHLFLVGDTVRTTRGPRENGYRPAVDVLFRSAARSAGNRTIAAVLSGALDDGSAGAQIVAARGGLVLVQDPEDALYPGMPSNALDAVQPSMTGTAHEIGQEIVRLAASPVPHDVDDPSRELTMETEMAELDQETLDDPDRPGVSSGFSCPDCQGVLFELGPGDRHLRFRCRVGHAWTAVSLLAQQDASLEHALWMALRGLEEKAVLARRMANTAQSRGSARTAQSYEETAAEALRATGTLRRLLLEQPGQMTSLQTEPAVAATGPDQISPRS